MVAIIVCNRFHWTLEEYLGTDAAFVDKVFQYMTIESEVRNRKEKKVEQSLGKKTPR